MNSTAPQNENATSFIPDGVASVESILCTEELNRRPSRPPDYMKESGALLALAQALSDSPRTILQTLADTTLEVLRAGSAGISLLTTHDGGKRFYWPAISGIWKPHIGGGTPRDFGPCGDVLDRNTPLMFQHFERRYTYFAPVTPPVEECLLVPFYVEGKAVGTVWAIAHDGQRKFDAEDLRLLVSLGRFASAAYQVWQTLDAVGRLAAIVEWSDDAILSKDLNGVITSWNKGAERLFGYTAKETIGQPVSMLIPSDRLDEEPDILARIRRGDHIDHYETVRRCKDGTLRDISLTVSPLIDSHGKIVGASKIVRDITERKRMENELAMWQCELESRVEQRTAQLTVAQVQLLAEINERRRLESEVAEAVEGEQLRLGQELHDGLGQELTAIRMMLEVLAGKLKRSPERAREADKLVGLLGGAVNKTRNLASGFYPVELEKHGLQFALRELARRTQELSGISCGVHVDEDGPAELKDLKAVQFFRIAQEAIHNAVKHSEAKHITIYLTLQNGVRELAVRDDGVGLPSGQQHTAGMGLRIMQYRARMINGSLSVRNHEGGGVILSCSAGDREAQSLNTSGAHVETH